MAVEKLSKAKM